MLKINSNNFIIQIEELCSKKNLEYIDAIVHWCELNNFEVETAAEIIKKDPVIKSKIEFEAENINVLKRSARLPI